MELFSRFKKDYFNYLVSIILPALISGLSIPLFKQLLGAEGYGTFALWMNAILMLTAVFSGWIAQSILRFFPASSDQSEFAKRSMLLVLRTQLFFTLPVFIIAWMIGNDLLLAVLVALAVLACSLQFITLPLAQSLFLSRKIILSEIFRIVIYIGGSVCLLLLTSLNYLHSLFLAMIVSYLVSFGYLFIQTRNRMQTRSAAGGKEDNSKLIRQFFSYGIPLALWFVFSYLLTYIDKLFALRFFGSAVQGNYQALFDFLNKSLTLVISPVITSIFPLLTAAYVKGDRKEIKTLLIRLGFYELIGFCLVTIGYWLFGAKLLSIILHTPNTPEYNWAGFIIIAATFIWQFAMLAHKRLEMHLRSKAMLVILLIAFSAQVLFYLIMRDEKNLLIAPIGYFIAASIYFGIIIAPQIAQMVNGGERKRLLAPGKNKR